MTIYAFALHFGPYDDEEIINAPSANAAKYRFLCQVEDCGYSIKYTDIRCRKLGKPVSTERFLQTARYRGLPDLRCGDRIRLKGPSHDHCITGDEGYVIGSNESANFTVFFYHGRFKGETLSVHPGEMEVLEAISQEATCQS